MKAGAVIISCAAIASVTALAIAGVIAGDEALGLLKTLASGAVGGGVVAGVLRRT